MCCSSSPFSAELRNCIEDTDCDQLRKDAALLIAAKRGDCGGFGCAWKLHWAISTFVTILIIVGIAANKFVLPRFTGQS